jgi:hypothetical protein
MPRSSAVRPRDGQSARLAAERTYSTQGLPDGAGDASAPRLLEKLAEAAQTQALWNEQKTFCAVP